MPSLPLPLVLSTGNADKAREINEIFVALIDEPLAAWAITAGNGTFGYAFDRPGAPALPTELDAAPDVEETGATLEENARIKAKALSDAMGTLAIADDTGLEVDALDGAPGIYAARYSGEHATYAGNVAKLLRELEGTYPALRTARFATVALAYWPDGRELAVRGEVEGVIAAAPSGEGGFGYDPVFVPTEGDGRTFAQMTAAEKHAISHRGRAFSALAVALST
jgi:XTP/dITP diphosphohydrolase